MAYRPTRIDLRPAGARTFLSAATPEERRGADSLTGLTEAGCCGQECPRSGLNTDREGGGPAGFTLVEVMVAMGLASLVLLTVSTLLFYSNRSFLGLINH